MKCPKCGYLGFDDVERCRNCGYRFSLAEPLPPPDFTLNPRDLNPPGPLELARVEPPARTPGSAAQVDLPLFDAVGDDQPLITNPSPPRPPLAVRRATPEMPRPRPDARLRAFDLGFDDEPAPRRASTESRDAPGDRGATEAPGGAAPVDAGLGPRLLAALVDVAILAALDVCVVYLTAQVCGLGLHELALLPKAPLLAFLAMENAGYLVAFTAAGQTLGKMAAGIRIVTAEEAQPLGVAQAALRTLAWLLLVAPVGLGLLTAAFAADRRGLHDRLAGTRVIRVSA